MAETTTAAAADIVELTVTDGVAFVEQASPLTRLHYFDGKFLRADAFATEQDYHRARVQLANLAGGWGVVHGLGVAQEGAQLLVAPGLAITPAGSFVLATTTMRAALAELIRVQRPLVPAKGSDRFTDCLEGKAPAGVQETAAQAIYAITVGPVEGLCGNEPVYGKLCDSACATDSRHPYWREGVVLRLRRITLALPLPKAVTATAAHLRNRVASAWFDDEPGAVGSALSAAGLAGSAWCGTAGLDTRDEVVIGVLVREGGSTTVLDAWTGRRERMDSQARGHWQGRMAMRPWNVFVAQVLQFQCQLSARLQPGSGVMKPVDDCADVRALLDKTRKELEAVTQRWRQSAEGLFDKAGGPSAREFTKLGSGLKAQFAEIGALAKGLAVVEAGAGALPVQRMLIEAGFLDLPPAGYLPVVPGKTALETQLQRMFGEGVALHLHAVRADEIAHLVEEAQHLGRISLTRGLEKGAAAEEVEVFVPDGRESAALAPATGLWWRVQASGQTMLLALLALEPVLDDGAAGAGASIGHDMAAPQADTKAGTKAGAKAAPKAAAKAAARASAKATTLAATQATEASELRLAEGDNVRPTGAIELQAPIPGLARTWAEGEGHAFALVLAPGLGAPSEADFLGTPYRPVKLARAGKAEVGRTKDTSGAPLWLAGSLDADLFALEIGESSGLRAELRAAAVNFDVVLEAAGRLTLLTREVGSGGAQRVRVQLDLRLDATARVVGRDPITRQSTERARFVLQRSGDAGGGVLLADTDPLDLSDGAATVEWSGPPHEALLSLVQQAALKIVEAGMNLLAQAQAQASTVAADAATAAAPVNVVAASVDRQRLERLDVMRRAMGIAVADAVADTAAPAAKGAVRSKAATAVGLQREVFGFDSAVKTDRLPLAGAQALAAMPGPDSVLGAAALEALALLADRSGDAAFLARARRALLPTLDTPALRRVTGPHDWVMFRRARSHLCAPLCAPPAAEVSVDALQVWHLALQDRQDLAAVARALDTGDAPALARLRFQRVGVLRYRDANTEPEDSAARVLALWGALELPAQARVVLGRAWEAAPATGQGWQNHFRLRAMLERIAPLVTPPVRGDGSVKVMAPPPEPLADGALDGGMVVVTAGGPAAPPQPQPAVTHHRVMLLVDNQGYGRVLERMKVDGAAAWEIVSRQLGNGATELDLKFVDGQLDPVAQAELVDAEKRALQGGDSAVARTLRIDATPQTLPAAAAAGQHETVLKALRQLGAPQDDGGFAAPVPDLGSGATVMTVVSYARLG